MVRTRRLFALLAVVVVPLACADEGGGPDPLAPAVFDAKLTSSEGLTVMSQNLYLGVELATIFEGDVLTAFQQLVASNAFDAANPAYGPRRLYDIAWRIAAESPHLVGLQEVVRYEFDLPDQTTSTLDFLTVLVGWLNAFHTMGLTPYQWTPIPNVLVTAPPLTLPLPTGDITVHYYDSDAILVRSDVSILEPPVVEVFDAVQYFDVLGTSFPFSRGYEAVTVDVDGQELVFANTHLEVQQFEDVQLAQTAELIAALADTDRPVVAVGDFNSAANHDAPEDQKSGSYRMLRNAGFADLWLREAHSVGGVTCCQAGDLTNAESELTQRLDLVLARWGAAGFGGQSEMEVVGEEPGDRISFTAYDPFTGATFPLALWPSDHAGVVATLWPAPGRAMNDRVR